MMSLSSEGQHLSANQPSSTYLNPRLRYNYFRFWKTTVSHIGILLTVSILTIWPYLACHCTLGCPILSKSIHPQQRYVISIFKMAAAAAQYYFRFRVWWCQSLPKVNVYLQTKFHRHILIHGWDITTSGLEKQPSAILEFYFQFRFRPYRSSRHVILHQSAKLRPHRTTHSRKMTSCRFSRWQISAILNFRDPMMGSLKILCTTSFGRQYIL